MIIGNLPNFDALRQAPFIPGTVINKASPEIEPWDVQGVLLPQSRRLLE